jgi:hypothetical protein
VIVIEELRCWICRRTKKEVAEELIKLKAKGVWATGVPEDELVELPFNDKEDHTLVNIPLCYVCSYMVQNIADGIVDNRAKEDLMTEKDIQRIKVHLEVEPEETASD